MSTIAPNADMDEIAEAVLTLATQHGMADLVIEPDTLIGDVLAALHYWAVAHNVDWDACVYTAQEQYECALHFAATDGVNGWEGHHETAARCDGTYGACR